jgi:hypothetical protein
MKKLALFFIAIPLLVFSQEASIPGYSARVSGNDLSYHSPLPEVTTSLLVRSNPDFNSVEWLTDTIPAGLSDDNVTFLWMFGIDVNIDSHPFDLYLEGQYLLTFTNPEMPGAKTWSIEGEKGSRLGFLATMVDKYGDYMGFATLRVPARLVTKGKPAVIRITGDRKGSNAWYMTFKSRIEERISCRQENVVIREESRQFYVLRTEVVSFNEGKAAIDITGLEEKKVDIHPGLNVVRMNLPVATAGSAVGVSIKVTGKPEYIENITVKPVREWTVYLVQHTHTDIGYTRPQTEILSEHLRYIDYALDYCDLTDSLPDDARFRWTCESSWAVNEYLKSRPADQVERLRRRVEEGRIEITGMYFNMSDIIDEVNLAASLQPIRILRETGLRVETAMQNDVNGIGWAAADYFSGMGVRYLIMGEHGHRALIPFDKPTAFWWESPSGKRVLAYRGEHYMYGNFLGVHTGDLPSFENNLLRYLDDLALKDYPFDRISLQHSGYVTDNSPPSMFACELVKAWNRKYAWPKLRIATAGEFMHYVDDNHAADLPVYRVAWPDWWTDGAGSAMRETAATRTTQSAMIANQGLLAMATLLGAKLPVDISDEVACIHDDLLFYDEHTYGAAESISDPMAENSMVQWSEKASYAWEAVKSSRLLQEKAMGFLQQYLPRQQVPSVVVFNTLGHVRSGLVEAYIDFQLLPPDREFRIVDPGGKETPVQLLSKREDGAYWAIWCGQLPPFGFRVYRIMVSEQARDLPREEAFNGTLENSYYRLAFDTVTGGIVSLFDKESGIELSDTSGKWQPGQFIYEKLSNRVQIEQHRLDHADRTPLTKLTFESVVDGPVWKSLAFTGRAPVCADDRGVKVEIRLYHAEKRLELLYGMHKLPVTDPEAVYVAFPFGLPGAGIAFEVQGGLVMPGVNQLEGTSSDWNTLQNFAVIRNDKSQVVFGSAEAPLVQFGDINTGRFAYLSRPEKPHLYSWVLNNYWTTNFAASQEGELKWKYYLTSSGRPSNTDAARFGWNSRVPLVARVFPGSEKYHPPQSSSLLGISNDDILLVNALPSAGDNGIILQLRELEGKETTLKLSLPGKSGVTSTEVNVLGDPVAEVTGDIRFDPYETKFIRLNKK